MLHRHSMPVFYAFAAFKGPSPAALARFCIGPEWFVETFFPRAELLAEMGGWVRFVHDGTGERWLGVWGARKTQRFRRMLRERGAVFTVEKVLPAGIRQSVSTTTTAIAVRPRAAGA